MKKFYSLVLVIFTSLSTFAAVITANSNGGSWSQASAWDLGRVPQNGDVIIIPANVTVTVPVNVSLAGVQLNIYGTLDFSTNGVKITLDATSGVSLAVGGLITGAQGNNSDKLTIANPSGSPIIVYSSQNPPAGTGDQTGPKSWGNAPQPIILPVKFSSFNLARQQSDVLVQWATAQEMNSKSFIIERSSDGTNWTTVATISAAGQSNTLLDYSYTDRNVNGTIFYYRIKEVDIDNSFSYTSVKSIKMDNSSVDVKVIPASGNTLYVNFSQQVKSNVTMRLISMSGQVVSQQMVSNPIGQVNFSTSNHSTGIYVLSVTDGHDFVISKKVIL
jgi:hypothetical protein